ncbi:DsbE family thiol:disulfide interchange protein [Photobacterium damselae]|uniref:DsbE family thiol:disulfide interchange protein n=1 Tax=Photobacterium damselae TaxID=38293 RepID=UPI002F3F2F7C
MLLSKHKIAIFVTLLSTFIAVLLWGVHSQRIGPQTQSTVTNFPEREIVTILEQQPFASKALFSEPYQIVNVWASWCGYCRAEHGFLHQIAKEGVPIIGLNYRDRRSAALNYLGQLGNPYKVVMYDPDGRLAIDLGVIGTPETYLVNRAGNIVYKFSGALDQRAWQRHFADYFALKEEG